MIEKYKIVDNNQSSPLVELWYFENEKWHKWGGVFRKVVEILKLEASNGQKNKN